MHGSRSFLLYIASVSIASLVSVQALAWDRHDCLSNIYLGADIQARHLPYKSNFGHNLFRDHMTQGNIYAGFKVNPNFGFEFGYEEGRTRHRQTTLSAGEFSAGVEIPDDLAPATFRNYSRVAGGHVNAVGYFSPCDDCLQIIGSAGFTYARARFTRITLQMSDMTDLPDNSRIFTRQRLVARAMGALQYRFMDCLSVRGSLIWENTKGLKSTYPTSTSTLFLNQIRPQDSIILGLGLVWHFDLNSR